MSSRTVTLNSIFRAATIVKDMTLVGGRYQFVDGTDEGQIEFPFTVNYPIAILRQLQQLRPWVVVSPAGEDFYSNVRLEIYSATGTLIGTIPPVMTRYDAANDQAEVDFSRLTNDLHIRLNRGSYVLRICFETPNATDPPNTFLVLPAQPFASVQYRVYHNVTSVIQSFNGYFTWDEQYFPKGKARPMTAGQFAPGVNMNFGISEIGEFNIDYMGVKPYLEIARELNASTTQRPQDFLRWMGGYIHMNRKV
jgi:hypothetical protein